jgi:rifampicin phosphotransferase
MQSMDAVLANVTELEPAPSVLFALDEATDASRCGQKAASLAELRRLAFDIPDGFVIPVGCAPTRAEVAAALARLGDGPVAVRSSGVAEDLADASFAGQYETVLDVRGADAVLDAAQRCVASASHERVSAYGGESAAMAVLVQRMVPATAAGVAFSANPLNGDRSEVRISATRGIADKLVSGEVDADEWSVRGVSTTPLAQPQRALEPEQVQRIAELATRCEAARGAPQDIEWAMAGARLLLLQSRPITVLPVAPVIDVLKGTWQKDAAHFPEPITPFGASTNLFDEGQFFEPVAAWGALPDNLQARVIGHEFYLHVEPDDGGKAPPPGWLIAIVARLLPSLRRKLAAAKHAVEAGWLDSVPKAWAERQRAEQRQAIEALGAVDLAALDDDALYAHLEELRVFCGESMKLHFKLFVPYSVGVHELVQAAKELLGWSTSETMRLLQGLSSPSVQSTQDLGEIARLIRARPGARAIVESPSADFVARLEQVDPEVASKVRGYLRFWGLRPFISDAGSPTVAERPGLVAELLADLVHDDATPDLATPRNAAIAAARVKLSGQQLARFDRALAYAELVYAVREDNVLLTDQLPTGLLRRASLEAGRRLVALARLGRKEDVAMLTLSELRNAAVTAIDMKPLVARRKAELAWVRANPGPMIYGAPPGKLPDIRGLPEPARRINGAMLFMLDEEVSGPPQANATTERSTLEGIAASPGVYRGRVRVIRTTADLHRLRPGEVLVCPITTAAWMMTFQRAGALVTDAGSALSHTAIVAREYGLPAVVATSNGTSTSVDGEEVVVDGNRGTVERLAPTRS